jgi:hypothetical protein
MYVIDKTFSLLVIQSLLAVYLLNVYNEARLERKGNILDQWNGKVKLKVGDKKVDDGSENTFWANMFKKFYNQDGKLRMSCRRPNSPTLSKILGFS